MASGPHSRRLAALAEPHSVVELAKEWMPQGFSLFVRPFECFLRCFELLLFEKNLGLRRLCFVK